MNPSQVIENLASILSEAAGNDALGKKIPVVDSYNVPLVGNADKDCKIDHSSGFIRLILRNWPRPECREYSRCCLSHLDKTVAPENDRMVGVTTTEYEANYTVIAVRCGAADLLHRLDQELSANPCKLELHPDFKELPQIGDVLNVSLLGDDDAFQDRFEATLTVRYCDRAVCELPCVEHCFDDKIKILN